jgi:hypothetical protein
VGSGLEEATLSSSMERIRSELLAAVLLSQVVFSE